MGKKILIGFLVLCISCFLIHQLPFTYAEELGQTTTQMLNTDTPNGLSIFEYVEEFNDRNGMKWSDIDVFSGPYVTPGTYFQNGCSFELNVASSSFITEITEDDNITKIIPKQFFINNSNVFYLFLNILEFRCQYNEFYISS